MSVEIKVPSLGESVSEATIAKWYKKSGDQVKVDELILELETEKVTLEVNSPVSGVVEKISKQEGDSVSVDEIVGSIKEGAIASESPSGSSKSNIPVESKVEPSTKVQPANMLPPSAARVAHENNVDVSNIKGSGKDGRITKNDVVENVSASNSNISQNNSEKLEERVRMSRLRKTIAQRLKDSQNNAAILTTFNEIDMTNVIAMRKRYKEEFEKKHGIKLGFMSFFVKAVVSALQEIPAVNAEIQGDDIVYKKYYDIGVAVGTDQGLVVPVIRNCQNKSFNDIEMDIAGYGKKAKEGKLSMSDLTGATFTVSNGGVYGSLMSTPIINPPQSGILGMHKTQERAMVVNGEVKVRSMMYIALSYDHRIIDGKEAVTFLVHVKNAIENPERLLIGL